MSRAVFVLALGAALLVGGALGYLGRRARERFGLPARLSRPPALERALRALDAGDAARARRALASLAPGEPSDPRHGAERALVEALLSGETAALEAVARAHPGSPAAARAHWRLVAEMAPGPAREARRQAFAAAWPDAWVLREGADPNR